MIKLFIDECLSAALAAQAKEKGFVADYGPHIGTQSWQDWSIARFALERDYTIVTNNRRDFLKEYLKVDVHCGLIVIVPQVERARQMDLFERVLDKLDPVGEPPIGELIEVTGGGAVLARRWTSGDHDITYLTKPPK